MRSIAPPPEGTTPRPLHPPPRSGEADPEDLAAWSSGIAALHRLPVSTRASLLEHLDTSKQAAVAELAERRQHTDFIRFGMREGLAGMPLPVCAAGAECPAGAGVFLIHDFLKPGITMLAGEEGSGKSYLARQCAIVAAAGLPYFLVDRYAIERPLRVLLVDEDNGEAEEWMRTEQVRNQLGVERDQLIGLYRISLAGIDLGNERWQRWLLELVDELRLDVVILDPISEMHTGEELRRDPGFKSLLIFLKRLKVEHPTLAVILVHHVRKSPAGEKSAVRALRDVRGQWGQTPDVVAVLSPLGEGRARWELHKRVPHSSLILQQNDGIFTCVAEESERRASTDDRIIAAVDAGAETVEQICIASGLKERTIWNGVRRLREVGILTRHMPLQRVSPEDAE